MYRVCAVGPWRYGVTLLPGASRPDDERDEGKVDEVLRTRSENGWELVNAGTERDGKRYSGAYVDYLQKFSEAGLSFEITR